ncbi:MAG: M20 metallopeptidase family protein [Brevinema sp.]
MTIKERAENEVSFMRALRRDLHMHPELSFCEKKTSARIQEELTAIGVPFEIVGDYGIVATIEGQNQNNMIALRADMDALPIQEETGLDYQSTMPNVMHACGHDAHVAMLLGAARILTSIKPQIKGTIKLCFQQAEEVGGGASEILTALKPFPIKSVFAIHIWSEIPMGKVSIREGFCLSGVVSWRVIFKGKGTHGAIPHEGISPLIAAAAFVMNLNSCWAYEFSPFENITATTGVFQAGNAANVIPETAEVAGTARMFSPEQREKFKEMLLRLANSTAEGYRTQSEVIIEAELPSVYNDPHYTKLTQQCVSIIINKEALYDFAPLMVSENYGLYVQEYPGVMALVGGGNPKKNCVYPHHNSHFDIDEDALAIGAALHVEYALKVLE